ncbi:MAG: hypothetical protein HZB41_09490 [Ignavibacteriae bacterium]|nr:hypothetical protein [Ignavibacteriota bacterium]
MKIPNEFKLQIASIIIIVLTYGILSCGNSYTASAHSSKTDSTKIKDNSFDKDSILNENSEEPAEIISMISIIANPEKYHGKILRVLGYLNLEFEGDAIYLHLEDYKYFNLRNGLWVDIQSNSSLFKKKNFKKINHKYVFIQGKFDMNMKGHFGMWSGSIRNITSIDVLTMFKK